MNNIVIDDGHDGEPCRRPHRRDGKRRYVDVLHDGATAATTSASAATTNGTEFWIAGAGGSTAGGVWYNTLGAAGAETRVVSTPNNVRWLAIFGNQLYASSKADPYSSVFAIGFGTPTAEGQTATVRARPAQQRREPLRVRAVRRERERVAGLDTLYLATDAAGLQKWTFNGTTWGPRRP